MARFIVELKIGKNKAHRINFPTGRGRRDLRAIGGTKVGEVTLLENTLRIEFTPRAGEDLLAGAGQL